MSANPILAAFNKHFVEFIDDILRVFPDNVDILTAKKGLDLLRSKGNPKLVAKLWHARIAAPYAQEISAGNIQFFIEKDYSTDVGSHESGDQIQTIIDRLRGPVSLMNEQDKANVMKYIQNLSRLAAMVVQQ